MKLDEIYQDYVVHVFAPYVPQAGNVQYEEMRNAFFAGAKVALSQTRITASELRESLDEFQREVDARALRAEERERGAKSRWSQIRKGRG